MTWTAQPTTSAGRFSPLGPLGAARGARLGWVPPSCSVYSHYEPPRFLSILQNLFLARAGSTPYSAIRCRMGRNFKASHQSHLRLHGMGHRLEYPKVRLVGSTGTLTGGSVPWSLSEAGIIAVPGCLKVAPGFVHGHDPAATEENGQRDAKCDRSRSAVHSGHGRPFEVGVVARRRGGVPANVGKMQPRRVSAETVRDGPRQRLAICLRMENLTE